MGFLLRQHKRTAGLQRCGAYRRLYINQFNPRDSSRCLFRETDPGICRWYFSYLEPWHSWGTRRTRRAQSWALQGTETLFGSSRTHSAAREAAFITRERWKGHVGFGSKSTKSNSFIASCIHWHFPMAEGPQQVLRPPVTHKILIYEWSASL